MQKISASDGQAAGEVHGASAPSRQIQRENQTRFSHSAWVSSSLVKIGQNHAKFSSGQHQERSPTRSPRAVRRAGARGRRPISLPIAIVSARTMNGSVTTA